MLKNLFVSALVLSLLACGQRGGLYLPPEKDEKTVAAQTAGITIWPLFLPEKDEKTVAAQTENARQGESYSRKSL